MRRRALTLVLLVAVPSACVSALRRGTRRGPTPTAGAVGKVKVEDHLTELLIEANRPTSDPVATARSVWTEHERRLGYLVRSTFLPGLEDLDRAARTDAVLAEWAPEWSKMIPRMERLQSTFERVVAQSARSFGRTFGEVPDAEVHLVFVPDPRSHVAARVYGDPMVIVNAARIGESNEVLGRVAVARGLFELLRLSKGGAPGPSTAEGLCWDARSVRAAAEVYPSMERDHHAGVAIPPGVVPLESGLPKALLAIKRRFDEPDPLRTAGGEARPLLLLVLGEAAFRADLEVEHLVDLAADDCVATLRTMVGAP